MMVAINDERRKCRRLNIKQELWEKEGLYEGRKRKKNKERNSVVKIDEEEENKEGEERGKTQINSENK